MSSGRVFMPLLSFHPTSLAAVVWHLPSRFCPCQFAALSIMWFVDGHMPIPHVLSAVASANVRLSSCAFVYIRCSSGLLSARAIKLHITTKFEISVHVFVSKLRHSRPCLFCSAGDFDRRHLHRQLLYSLVLSPSLNGVVFASSISFCKLGNAFPFSATVVCDSGTSCSNSHPFMAIIHCSVHLKYAVLISSVAKALSLGWSMFKAVSASVSSVKGRSPLNRSPWYQLDNRPPVKNICVFV